MSGKDSKGKNVPYTTQKYRWSAHLSRCIVSDDIPTVARPAAWHHCPVMPISNYTPWCRRLVWTTWLESTANIRSEPVSTCVAVGWCSAEVVVCSCVSFGRVHRRPTTAQTHRRQTDDGDEWQAATSNSCRAVDSADSSPPLWRTTHRDAQLIPTSTTSTLPTSTQLQVFVS